MLLRRVDRLHKDDSVVVGGNTYRVLSVGGAEKTGLTGIVLKGAGDHLDVHIEAVLPNEDLLEIAL